MPYEIDTDPGGFGCWVWTGYCADDGTPVVRTVNGQTTARRWEYERLIGPIPPRRVLWPLCGNKLCVNPDHMEPITYGEKMRRQDSTVLDRRLAKRVLLLLGRGLSLRRVARLMGVSVRTVADIRDGKHWTQREEEESPEEERCEPMR